MTAIRKCNNNIIFALEKGQEVIALGKGIGFNAHIGGEVDINAVERVFVPCQPEQFDQFKNLLASLPYEYVILSGKIVDYGKARLARPLNQSIVIALADHLHFAITRLRDQIAVQMPLVWDIRHIYPAEFAVGREALRLIHAETGALLPEGEAAAIALHFINAESELDDMPNTMRAAGVITELTALVEARYQTVFDEHTPDFNGFIALLRGIITRFLSPAPEKQAKEDTVLYDLLHKRYAFAFSCAEAAATYAERKHHWRFSRNDVSFLTLYISRMTAAGGTE